MNTQRMAECYCGRSEPSANAATLAFFESRDAGSKTATEQCKHCGFHLVAHRPDFASACKHFEPKGAQAADIYYCGCRGWE